ncbi:GNAT family N-acetyltransferase [Pseudoalteromonas luteoviolacea]|uniref:GNAT family N-acetyltransferase n=1 Tax=Pseudoalteromonas luteoviolacea TaxID=43657 RepID=UPI001B3A59E4|nr:GNAT family protein [Pseudoalteromonas luteoviolacea]MBQ4877888.1 GNAT family N-acetyltransferase [Pseudoalteromonas luteoviolacea]MBQ4906923.1 GNAT family N-acetyltransferase [Pseudoalteromonas luteoviolacea]
MTLPDIQLTSLGLHHSAKLYNAVEHNRVSLERNLPWVKQVTCDDSAQRYIDERINSGEPSSRWIAISVSGCFSGVFGVKHIDPVTGQCEVGYWLCGKARGQQVIPRVLNELIPWIKSQGAKTLEFHCLEDNIASIRNAEKVGAILQSTAPTTLDISDTTRKMCVYALKF